MAPKKKKGKKSGKKKSARKSAKGSASKVTEALNELSKEFFLVQIRDLEQKLVRYQARCDEIEVKNKEVDTRFEQQATDKKEIVSFLKKQLEQRADEIADLQERLIGLQHAKDTERDKYELQLTTLRTEMQEIKDKLTSENMVLGGKLASLEEFRIQKEDLLSKFEEMEELLKCQEADHKEQIYQLERKAVVDKDRLKKEMILRVNTVAAEFRKVSNKQIAETTKRTIRENVVINSQLSKMSDKTMEMISENEDLRDKDKNQKQQLEILEFNERELMKKNAANLKIIRMLTERARKQENILKEAELKEQSYLKLENDFQQLRTELEMAVQNLNSLKEEKKIGEEQLASLKDSQQDLLEDKGRLITLLGNAAEVIKEALKQGESNDPTTKEHNDSLLLQKVIEILDLAVEMGVGVDLADLKLRRKYPNDHHSCGLGFVPVRTSCSPATRPLAHYKLGDLGLVPAGNRKMGSTRSAGEADESRKRRTKVMFYASEQLAKGTSPESSTCNLVKDALVKLPALTHLKQK